MKAVSRDNPPPGFVILQTENGGYIAVNFKTRQARPVADAKPRRLDSCRMIAVNPETGEVRLVRLDHHAEEMERAGWQFRLPSSKTGQRLWREYVARKVAAVKARVTARTASAGRPPDVRRNSGGHGRGGNGEA